MLIEVMGYDELHRNEPTISRSMLNVKLVDIDRKQNTLLSTKNGMNNDNTSRSRYSIIRIVKESDSIISK